MVKSVRGPVPEEKLSYKENFELVAMRHREFRKVDNPTTEELRVYAPVIEKAISRFVFVNRNLMGRFGLEREDLRTYAQVWTCNYLGLYRLPGGVLENGGKLYAHLFQRLGNFVDLLVKKNRDCVPDIATAYLGQTGLPFLEAGRQFGNRTEEDDPSADTGLFDKGHHVLRPEAEEDAGEVELDPAQRRKAAKKTLKLKLGALSHERLLELLVEAAGNDALCPTARSEASKQLRMHRRKCPSCTQPEKEADGGQ